MISIRPALAGVVAAGVLALAGCTPETDGPTTEDRAAFALAWSQQTEADKDRVCIALVVRGEHAVAEDASQMDRPQVFAALLAETCTREGR